MKLRLVAALLLLLVAVGLPLAAMSNDGPPWGFRGHQAVLVEVTGTVEATASEARRDKNNSIDDKLEVAANLHFDVGDEIRVARLSRALLRFPSADVVVGDGARVLVGNDAVTLARGVVDIELRGAARTFTVTLDAGGSLVVRGSGAHLVVLADGKGGTQAFVRDGSVEARTQKGDRLLEGGKLLVIRDDEASVVDPPATIEISATCSAAKLNVVAPAQTQVFAAGTLSYPDVAPGAATGSVVLDVDAGAKEAFVLGRNVYGHVGQTRVACDKRK
ncbi:MAG TPA: hypothetical protein VGF99_21130 [Myxococcota bacterium]